MRPIFRPSARVSVELLPSRIGCGTVAGCTRSGLAPVFELRVLAETDLLGDPSGLDGCGFEFAAVGGGGGDAGFANASFLGAASNAGEFGTIAAAAASSLSRQGVSCAISGGGTLLETPFAVLLGTFANCMGSGFITGPLSA